VADNSFLDEIGVLGEMVVAIDGPCPPPFDLAEKVAFLHQPQHPLVIYQPPFTLKLSGNPPVAIVGVLEADGLNLASQIRLSLHLYLALALKFVIEAAC
jgi:hypothetical protein